MTDQFQNQQRHYLSRRGRNALLTAHIVFSVGLLGDSAGFLAVAIRAAKADDPGARVFCSVLGRYKGNVKETGSIPVRATNSHTP